MAGNIYIYRTAPNQKTIITKKTMSDKQHTYGIFNAEATLTAAKTLSDRAFKLYVRMNLHQDGHTYALSPIEIMNATGMTEKRYREAVKELKEKGYLVETEKKSVYYFFESPVFNNTTTADSPADSGIPSGQFGHIARPIREDNPSILGGEIIHNITSHSTRNNTVDSNNMGDSLSDKFNSFIIQIEQAQKHKEAIASQVQVYDEDDARMYATPEIDEVRNYDLDVDLPF